MSESFAEGLVGIVLDERYRLDALLGEGGMGAVYRAHHLQMDRRVAIKLLKPHLTSDDAQVQRFMREARATMKVDSDHAVKVLDFGITPSRDYYMALEYLDGRTVQRELDVDGPFAPARVMHIARQALHALGAAHAAGLIHRDIKPDNLLLMKEGDDLDYTKVLDFGVAKLMEGTARTDRSAMAITQAGMVFGTPEYMSPEQACGQALDGRSDLYALAATMFSMLTGCGMYNAKTPIEWLTHHARTPPPHLTEGLKDLAPYTALDAAMQKCLAKRREDRPQTAAEMTALLDSVAPTLGRAKSAASSSARGLAMRAAQSSYFAAIDPNATLPPNVSAPIGAVAATPDSPYAKTMMPGSMQRPALSDDYARLPATAGSTTTGVIAEVHRGSRRGLWIVLGLAAVGAMIVAVAIVASRGKSSKGTVVAKTSEDAGKKLGSETGSESASVAPVDAPAAIEASHIDAGVPVDAAPVRPDAGVKRVGPNPEVAKLLAEAEAAQKSGNRLIQIQRADAALQLDPRNSRAKFLLGDGLIA
ncbi:MAG TPA: serine/threonine-protein kinase, partial [Kofleriaceae bacterium]|nr:serine/threonine-protein kinase [Kofleriaceae bacterium]